MLPNVFGFNLRTAAGAETSARHESLWGSWAPTYSTKHTSPSVTFHRSRSTVLICDAICVRKYPRNRLQTLTVVPWTGFGSTGTVYAKPKFYEHLRFRGFASIRYGIRCASSHGSRSCWRSTQSIKCEGTQSDIPPDFFTLRSHKCINNIRSGSNKFPLGTPLYNHL